MGLKFGEIMGFGRLRKILCNFEFSYLGIRYMARAFYLGDTANPKVVAGKDFTPMIVCQTLKITNEQLAALLQCKYWDITQEKLAKAGINFLKLEIYFYPPKDK